MDLLNLFVKIGAKDEASDKIDTISASAIAKAQVMGQAFYDAAKFVGGKALDMGKSLVSGALEGYGAYEQLAGGVEKLYGDSADIVKNYAKDAYMTSGMSANQYMEQATTFSAALVKSLGGDTQQAAELTDVAMRAMSDNVNVFGSDMESVQNAFSGFAKENYTMLDNLKMGYAGSKQGAEQLIKDAAAATESQKALGLTVDANSLSFDNMVKAIAVMEREQNIWGTTTKEAMGTIEGSVTATKAAWENLITAIGAGDPEFIEKSVRGLLDGIFGQFNEQIGMREGGIIHNVLPVVQRVGQAVIDVLPSIMSDIAWNAIEIFNETFSTDFNAEEIIYTLEQAFEKVSGVVTNLLDSVRAAYDAFMATFDTEALSEAFTTIGEIVQDVWGYVESNILPAMPTIGEVLGTVANILLQVGTALLQVLQSLGPIVPLIAGAVSALAVLQPILGIFSAISGAVTFFTTTVIPAIGAVQSFGGAIAALVSVLGGPITIIVAVVGAIAAFIASNEDARKKLLEIGKSIMDFFGGIPEWWNGVVETVKTAIKNAVEDNIKKWQDFKQRTVELWNQVKDGISNVWENIKSTVSNAASNAVSAVTGAWDNMRNAVSDKMASIRQTISDAWNTVKDTVSDAMSNVRQGVEDAWNNLINWLSDIPNRILNAFSGLGDLLWDAGSSIIDGLWDGMTSVADGLFNWVGGIADTIASLKGPLPYDRKVLIENGQALMGGLQRGLEMGFESEVKPYVSQLASEVSNGMTFSSSVDQARGTQKSGPSFALTIENLTVRDEDDAEYFARRVNDIWTLEVEGSLA